MALKDQWHGTLMFVAQPAEETLKDLAEQGFIEAVGETIRAVAAA